MKLIISSRIMISMIKIWKKLDNYTFKGIAEGGDETKTAGITKDFAFDVERFNVGNREIGDSQNAKGGEENDSFCHFWFDFYFCLFIYSPFSDVWLHFVIK